MKTTTFKLMLLFVAIASFSYAQNPMVYFNDKGAVTDNLPQKLLASETLRFTIEGDKDLLKEQKDALTAKAKAAIDRITKLTQAQLDLLDWVYDIKAADLATLNGELTSLSNGTIPANGFEYCPFIPSSLKDYTIKTINTLQANSIDLDINDPQSFPYPTTLKYSNKNRININLSRTDYLKKITFDWYNAKNNDFIKKLSSDDLKTLQSLYNDTKKLIDQLKDIIGDHPVPIEITDIPTEQSYIDKLTTVLNNFKQIQTICDFSDDKEWILYWFWYGNEKLPKLNPFPFQVKEDIKLPDTTALPALRLQIVTIEKYLNSLKVDNVSKAVADQYLTDDVNKRTDLGTQLKAYDIAKQKLANNDPNIAAFSSFVTLLNKLILIASDLDNNNTVYWMRHHNALEQAADMDLETAKEYVETDHVYVLTHNLTVNQEATVNVKYTSIANDQDHLTDDLVAAGKNLGSIKGWVAGASHDPAIIARVTVGANLNKLLFQVNHQITCILAAEYLLKQENPNLDVKPAKTPEELYHSQIKSAPATLGPQQAAYTDNITNKTQDSTAKATPAKSLTASLSASVSVDLSSSSSAKSGAGKTAATSPPASTNTALDTFKYRVNKLYRIFPMVGIAYTINQFGSFGTNAAGNDPGVFNSPSQAHFFGGVKVFINKTDIRNDNFIFNSDANGNPLFWTRCHLDLGVDLGSPLNNIYTGAGIDPWPGVGLNFGAVWNRYDYYQYSTSLVTLHQTRYRAGFYFGVTTDVALIAQIVKLLNL